MARPDLLARVLEPANLRRALQQVRRHQGAPGIDGRTGGELGEDLQAPGPTLRAAWLAGTSVPQRVRRTESPQPGGGTRHWGLPTVLERCLEHARLQVLQEAWDPTFAASRDGCRPQRRAHQAVEQAQAYSWDGDTGVVDLDREQCCDRGTTTWC